MSDDPRPDLPIDPTDLAHTPAPETEIAAPATSARLVAEASGTFLLVFGGIGAALFAANNGLAANGFPVGIGYVGVALAFASRSSREPTRGARSRAATSTPRSPSASPPRVAFRGATPSATSSRRWSAAPSRRASPC